MKIKFTFLCLTIALLIQSASAQDFNILPYPNKIEIGKGYFNLGSTIQIVNTVKEPMVKTTLDLLNQQLILNYAEIIVPT
jgi:hypothetical protein